MAASRTRDEWVAYVQLLKADLHREEQSYQPPPDPDENLAARAERLLKPCQARIELGEWLLQEKHKISKQRNDQMRSIRERLTSENPNLEDYRVWHMAHAELNKADPDPCGYLRDAAWDAFAEGLDYAEEVELEIDHPAVLIAMLGCYEGLETSGDSIEYKDEMAMAALELRKRLLPYANDVEESHREIAEQLRGLVWLSGVDVRGKDIIEWERARRRQLEAHAIYRRLVKGYPETATNVAGLLETLLEVIHYFPPAKGGAEYTEVLAFAEEARSALKHLRENGVELQDHEGLLDALNEGMASLE